MVVEGKDSGREDRGLLRIQRVIERIQGRRGNKASWREERAIEGTYGRRGVIGL